MKKHIIHAYEIIADDGKDVYRLHIPGTSSKQVASWLSDWAGMEAVKVKPSERGAACPISAERIAEALQASRFGQMEIDLIVRALTHYTDFVL